MRFVMKKDGKQKEIRMQIKLQRINGKKKNQIKIKSTKKCHRL